MPVIRMHPNAIEVVEENGRPGEMAFFHPTEDCLAAFNRAEAERLRYHARRWPRRLLTGFGILALVVYLFGIWAEGRP